MSHFKFITNSRNNRVFCDSLIRMIAVSCLTGHFLDGHEMIPCYSKYDSEIQTGKHGGYKFVPIHEKVIPKELHQINGIIYKGFNTKLKNQMELVNFIQKELNIEDDYTQVIGDLSYTFQIMKKKQNYGNTKTKHLQTF